MMIPISEARSAPCDDTIIPNTNHIPRLDREDLLDRAFLDKGMFGHVCLVELMGGPPALREIDSRNFCDYDYRMEHNQRNPLFALKSINQTVFDPEEAGVQLANEAKILSELDHENIIRLRGVGSETFSGAFRSRDYFLLLDVLDETLKDRLETWGKKNTNIRRSRSFQKLFMKDSDLRYKECQSMYNRICDSVLGIAKGLEYLHYKKIVWCDIKPANIGYHIDASAVQQGKSESTIKLIDFGLAARVDDCQDNQIKGSLRYMAPEIMLGQSCTLESDVFSFGVLLAHICSLRIPYSKSVKAKKVSVDDFQHKVVTGVLRPTEDLEKRIPCKKIRALIEECLDIPTNRPNFTDMVKRLTIIFDASNQMSETSITKPTYDYTQSLCTMNDLSISSEMTQSTENDDSE